MTGHVLAKSDVYSFGVVLLELLSGKLPVDHSRPVGSKSLVDLARPLLHSPEGHRKLADPSLGDKYPPGMFARVAAIASMCVQPEAVHRPEMGEVRQALRLVLIHSGALSSPTLSASSPATFCDPTLSPATGATGTPSTLSPGMYHAHGRRQQALGDVQNWGRPGAGAGAGAGGGGGGFGLDEGRSSASGVGEGGARGVQAAALHKSGPLDPSVSLGFVASRQGTYHTFAAHGSSSRDPNSHLDQGNLPGSDSDRRAALGEAPVPNGVHSELGKPLAQGAPGYPQASAQGLRSDLGQGYPLSDGSGYEHGYGQGYGEGDGYPMGPLLEEEPTGWKGCTLYDTDAEGNGEEAEEGGVPRLLRMQLHGLDYR